LTDIDLSINQKKILPWTYSATIWNLGLLANGLLRQFYIILVRTGPFMPPLYLIIKISKSEMKMLLYWWGSKNIFLFLEKN
jgi:hypothetical protein